MAIEINGIAHIQLTVADPDRCVPFWERLCDFMGMRTLARSDAMVYCIGGRTGVMVRGAPADKRDRPFDQDRPGLHHVCFRARSREDVDAVHAFAVGELCATSVHGPEESGFAPGYYSILLEDPDGIRVEVSYVPGAGHFGPGGRLGPGGAGTIRPR
jgi:catechol 2,3-dioxygenase-like lactoylglutathione lyase family enzyme